MLTRLHNSRRKLAAELVGADGTQEAGQPRLGEHPLRHADAVLGCPTGDVLHLLGRADGWGNSGCQPGVCMHAHTERCIALTESKHRWNLLLGAPHLELVSPALRSLLRGGCRSTRVWAARQGNICSGGFQSSELGTTPVCGFQLPAAEEKRVRVQHLSRFEV